MKHFWLRMFEVQFCNKPIGLLVCISSTTMKEVDWGQLRDRMSSLDCNKKKVKISETCGV